ncbi:MAG: 4-hydroxy-tetrahydrodipicolinate synthase [Verrucomicrobia bacterium CG1_02_43_26]|nr:MAG: 4-hydroxy-tetrahydrodipicolinate synthase [Verrucomicrobia bacterium CG1_02_43_26]
MKKTTSFYGAHTALITPMSEGKISWPCLEALIERQINEGIDGLIALGTTGETPTLTPEERRCIMDLVIKNAKGHVPVIVGTGSNNTADAVIKAKEAEAAGADALLIVAPYYNKPTQEGLFLHVSEIANATETPIILYSIPSRCGIEYGVDTMLRLREKFPHVIGVKEAGGSCDRVSEIKIRLDNDFLILSGDDSLTLPFMSVGAKGVISVASNHLPGKVSQMVDYALQNDFQSARKLHQQYYEFFKNIFIETNPAPIKYAMHKAGLIASPEVRLPLCQLSQLNAATLDTTMDTMELMSIA